MPKDSSEATPADVGRIALGMYGAWLAAMLGVWIWAEHRRRRDVERALEALRAHRMSYVPPHMHTAADFRPHPAPPVDGDGAAVNHASAATIGE